VYDQLLTQRLILQPRIDTTFALQKDEAFGVGSGLNDVELGLRARYEIRREFAPYIGIEQSWRTGNGADFARARGEDPWATSLIAGIRFWL